jgi:hypothetical protein
LRESIEKLRIREVINLPDPPDANILEIMKMNKIRDYLQNNIENVEEKKKFK